MDEICLVVDVISGLMGSGLPTIITQEHIDSFLVELERLQLDEEFKQEGE